LASLHAVGRLGRVELVDLQRSLDSKAYGLIVLATSAGDDVRRALWRELATCESLYWVGPLAEKPVVAGRARCWLLECALADRAQNVRVVLCQDPHAIHAIGLADAAVLARLVEAALVGCVAVVEVEAGSGHEAVDAVRAIGAVEPSILDAALVAGLGPSGDVALVRPL
jgi:hypothetical protein